MVTWHTPVQTLGVFPQTGAKWRRKKAFANFLVAEKGIVSATYTYRQTISVEFERKT